MLFADLNDEVPPIAPLPNSIPDPLGYTMSPCTTGDDNNDRFCCTGNGTPLSQVVQPPKWNKTGKAYPCEDHTEFCTQWVKNFPESCYQVTHASYGFMSLTCMKSCERCGNENCVDAYQECDKWSKKGYCAKYPEFMIFNCRESCGTCGFKSRNNVVCSNNTFLHLNQKFSP